MQFQTEDQRSGYITMYFVSLALLVASLPLSKFTMSLSEFSILIFWLWHGVDSDFVTRYSSRSLLIPKNLLSFLSEAIKNIYVAFLQKLKEFSRNKPAMVVSSILLLHLLGLIYTSDFSYAYKDIRTKLPILILPFIIGTGPRLSTKVFYAILALFVAAVIGGSIYWLILLFKLPIHDSRIIESHTSHIRYSLNAIFAIFILLFFIFSKGKTRAVHKLLLTFIVVWLLGFMIYMNFSTGILIFLFVSFMLLLLYTLRIRSLILKSSAFILIAILAALPVYYVMSIGSGYMKVPQADFSKLEKYTRNGNSYYHDTINFKLKTGKWAGLYICEKELRQAWAQRSKLSLDSLDKKKQLTRFTLIYYLASKDLRKDAHGVDQLTETDIRNVENGINRYDFGTSRVIQSQVEDFITSYRRYMYQHDPNSSSLVQRFEYWRTSLLLIKQHPLIGVGTGDLPSAFDQQYIKMNSDLAPQYRLRSHNQYLSITVGFGIIGFIWFMFALIYPGIKSRKFNNYFYLIFWVIFMVSMLTEDTIENQEGVTYFALFTAMLISGRLTHEPSESVLN